MKALLLASGLLVLGIAPLHKQPLVCPVTKLSIPSAKAAVGKSVYKGKTYYFCTSNCKRLFDSNPAKYAKKGK